MNQSNWKWYTRYGRYPEYCSTPEQMDKRTIPSLVTPDHIARSDFALLHVTSIIRHGARTPSKSHFCWEGWDHQKWDCELKTMTSPPAEPEILNNRECEHESEVLMPSILSVPHKLYFEKNYDALNNPPQLRNVLNGTCQKGQLLLRGYVQEFQNGRMLRKAYFNASNHYRHPTLDKTVDAHAHAHANDRSKQKVEHANIRDHQYRVLLDLNNFKNGYTHNANSSSRNSYEHPHDHRPYEEPFLYFRSDDYQRTLMSGQVLLRGLFGEIVNEAKSDFANRNLSDPTIIVHTADRERDILSPNAIACPKLNDLWDEAVNSKEYVDRFVDSAESKVLDRLLSDELGVDLRKHEKAREHEKDCMMTAICNDLDLPEILNDYDYSFGNGQSDAVHDNHNFFDRLYKYSYRPYNYILRYNDAAYSKLAFGPLWVDILSNILPFAYKNSWVKIVPQMVKRLRNPAPKLALFSAHDNTILPILATLGERVWDGTETAPYASMLNIELYKVQSASEIFDSGTAFRLVYNGKVLTEKIESCETGEELCDITALVKTVQSFAAKERDCASSSNKKGEESFHSFYDTIATTVEQEPYDSKSTRKESNRLTFELICLLVLVALLSSIIGSIFVYCY